MWFLHLCFFLGSKTQSRCSQKTASTERLVLEKNGVSYRTTWTPKVHDIYQLVPLIQHQLNFSHVVINQTNYTKTTGTLLVKVTISKAIQKFNKQIGLEQRWLDCWRSRRSVLHQPMTNLPHSGRNNTFPYSGEKWPAVHSEKWIKVPIEIVV